MWLTGIMFEWLKLLDFHMSQALNLRAEFLAAFFHTMPKDGRFCRIFRAPEGVVLKALLMQSWACVWTFMRLLRYDLLLSAVHHTQMPYKTIGLTTAMFSQWTTFGCSPHLLPIAFLQMYNAIVALLAPSWQFCFQLSFLPRMSNLKYN